MMAQQVEAGGEGSSSATRQRSCSSQRRVSAKCLHLGHSWGPLPEALPRSRSRVEEKSGEVQWTRGPPPPPQQKQKQQQQRGPLGRGSLALAPVWVWACGRAAVTLGRGQLQPAAGHAEVTTQPHAVQPEGRHPANPPPGGRAAAPAPPRSYLPPRCFGYRLDLGGRGGTTQVLGGSSPGGKSG